MDNIQITKDCTQTVSNIGSTAYHNICNGSVNIVNWGIGDWILAVARGTLLVVILGILTTIVVFMVKMSRDL